MAKQSVANELAKRIRELRAERREHLEALEQIDETFTALGIDPEGETAPRRGRPRKKQGSKATKTAKRATKGTKGAKKTTRRGRRGSYKQTAEQFVLGLLQNGRKLRTAEINEKWTGANRGGTANNTLSKLAKAGKVSKENIPGARGSQYSAA